MNLLRTYNQHPPQKKALKLCKTYNTMVFGNLLKGHTMFPLKASKSLFHLRLGVVALSVISTTRFIKLSRRQVLRPHESAECFPSATLPVKSHTGTSNKAQNTIFYAWGNIGIAGIAWIAFTKHLNLPKTVFEMHYPAFIKNPFYKQNNNNKKTLFWSLKTFFTPPGPADDCVEKNPHLFAFVKLLGREDLSPTASHDSRPSTATTNASRWSNAEMSATDWYNAHPPAMFWKMCVSYKHGNRNKGCMKTCPF